MRTARAVRAYPAQPCAWLRPARPLPTLIEDARAGLLAPPRSIPPKYFYDARGARLFEQICATPEYYLTRTEDALLADHGAEIIECARPNQILEFGSGSAAKTRRLFDACARLGYGCAYAPLDVCEEMLLRAARDLRQEYPWLEVAPISGDYHAGLDHLPRCSGRRLAVFLGSSIGNFTPSGARVFLIEIRDCLRPGDYLLLGADRVKDTAVLHAAYNDAAGVTAEFNRNLLRVLNRGLQADFFPGAYAHEAVYNADKQRIEMYLRARQPQQVRLGLLRRIIHIGAGERLLTELSCKYTAAQLHGMLETCGFSVRRHFEPANRYFSLLLARRGI
jgi:L-histidine N-alpha-methyltransferase